VSAGWSYPSAWLTSDRAIALSKRFGLEGPPQRWEQIRTQIHDEILQRAYDPQRHTFTQFYGSTVLDAAPGARWWR
jgi:GH15 family glucan-1,4-alpha-glucosidase